MRQSGRPRQIGDDIAQQVVDLYKDGAPIKQIEQTVGIHKSTIYEMLKRHGLTARRTTAHKQDSIGFELQDMHTEQEQIMHCLVLDNQHLKQMILDMGVYAGTATSEAVPHRTQTASSVVSGSNKGENQ